MEADRPALAPGSLGEGGLTPAACRDAGHEVFVCCRRCRVGRFLDLARLAASPADTTPIGALWARRRLVCRKCRSSDCTAIVSAVHVGTTMTLEVWDGPRGSLLEDGGVFGVSDRGATGSDGA